MWWLELLFAGAWSLLWKFGLGFGIIALGIAWWWFAPIFKKWGLYVAGGTAIWISAYAWGAYDEHKRVYAQAEVRVRQELELADRTRALAEAEVDGTAGNSVSRWLRRDAKSYDRYDRRQRKKG